MPSQTPAVLYVLVLAGAAMAQSAMTVNTPASVVQCQPVNCPGVEEVPLTSPRWIIPGQQAGAAALKEFPSQTGTSLTWTVDLIANTYITVQIRDSTGAVQYSSAVSIQNSSDSSCVNSNVSATASKGGSTATATGGATSAAATPTATTPAGSASGSSSRVSASATASSSAASSTSSNAASVVTKGAFGVAGIAGLIGATLF